MARFAQTRACASVDVSLGGAHGLAARSFCRAVDPAIAGAAHGLENVARPEQLVELAAQPMHALAQRVALFTAGATPRRGLELLHRDEPAGLLKKRAQEDGLERRQREPMAVDLEHAALDVESAALR